MVLMMNYDSGVDNNKVKQSTIKKNIELCNQSKYP